MTTRMMIISAALLVILAALMPPEKGLADCVVGKKLYERAMLTLEPQQRITTLLQSANECEGFNVFLEIGKSYFKIKDFVQAAKWFDKAGSLPATEITRIERSKALAGLGNVYAAQGKIAEALVSFKQALVWQDDQKIQDYVLKLEVEKSNTIVPTEEIFRSLNEIIEAKAFGVVGGLDLPINFELNTTALNEAGRKQTANLGKALGHADFSGKGFVLSGHTDVRGEVAYNQKLSEDRAAAVKNYLVQNCSIQESRLQTKGYGESKPLHQGDSEAAHQVNRRVVVEVQ